MSAAGTLDIAVIIVSYRSAALTVDALRSLAAERATSGLAIRAVVVDNASGDAPQIAHAVSADSWQPWVTLITAPRNGGFAYGNNLGIEHAYAHTRPDYIYLLNPDTQVRPGAIGSLIRFLEQQPEVGIAGSTFENQEGVDWPMAFRFPTLFSEIDSAISFWLITRALRRWVVAMTMDKFPQRVEWVAGASMMVRAAVIDAIGGLDENYFLYFEEPDFCYRANRAGFSTWYVPSSRVMHIGGQSTKVHCIIGPERLPPWWFESRRRYFAVRFGIARAMVIDVAAVLAAVLGLFKRTLLGRQGTAVSHYIRDLLHYSVLWRANRNIPALRTFAPGEMDKATTTSRRLAPAPDGGR
jgi:GT2 family glycosyltransferase